MLRHPLALRRAPSGLAVLLSTALVAGACGTTQAPVLTGEPSPTAATAVPTADGCPRPPAAERPELPWWSERVFYEVFVRSFADSDGDGIGDLRGLTARLDYLNDGDPSTTDDLGITGIWLMPVAEAASYHGYDVVDYRAIERDYGSTEDFHALVAEAHRRGIAVIVDLVLNHTSRDHPWFREARAPGSRYDDWYVWSHEHPGYGGPAGQPVWHPDGDRFYYAQFWEGMPDLDLENPEVTAELDAVARYWLDEMGVDGFRLDAIKHLVEDGETQVNTPATHAWLEGFHARVAAANPDALLVGEVFDATIVSSSYVPDAVDLVFDFELAGKILLGARIGEAPSLASAQRDVLERYPPRQYAAFLTNHDQNRVMSQLGHPLAVRTAATVLLTNPGVPFVYYGEEIGLPGTKPDERIRTPLPWDGSPMAGFSTVDPWQPLEPGWETTNVTAQLDDPGSLLAHYRALIRLRGEHPALTSGAFVPVESGAPTVYAFLASDESESVAVVVNLGADQVDDYALSLDPAIACEVVGSSLVYADGFGPGVRPVAPVTGPNGTRGWRPVPALPAHSTLVVALRR